MRGKTRPDLATARSEALSQELTPGQAGDTAVRGMETPADARARGELEGVKTPMVGKSFQKWIEHHTAFKTALAVLSLGTVGGFTHHPVLASLPLAYLGGSRAAAAMLANPARAKAWMSVLKSKNAEQAGFYLGRLAAASMTEAARGE